MIIVAGVRRGGGYVKVAAKPYVVTYYKDGEKKTIRRQPPPQLHDFAPQDKVALNYKRNDDYPVGGTYTVKGFNPRHPNTIQVTNARDQSTFVSFQDLNLLQSAKKEGDFDLSAPENNRYLLWP